MSCKSINETIIFIVITINWMWYWKINEWNWMKSMNEIHAFGFLVQKIYHSFHTCIYMNDTQSHSLLVEMSCQFFISSAVKIKYVQFEMLSLFNLIAMKWIRECWWIFFFLIFVRSFHWEKVNGPQSIIAHSFHKCFLIPEYNGWDFLLLFSLVRS